MDLSPGIRYGFLDMFDGPAVELRDGSRIFTSRGTITGARPEALLLNQAVQFSLGGVTADTVHGLPGGFTARQLLRENLLLVRGAGYAFDMLMEVAGQTFLSRGAVCVRMALQDDQAAPMGTTDRQREVQTAWERGLLDDTHWRRADFKLGIRSLQRKIAGLNASDYVPPGEWQVDVLFANWRDEATGGFVDSPLVDIAIGEAVFSFRPGSGPRGFRMTDLFKAHY